MRRISDEERKVIIETLNECRNAAAAARALMRDRVTVWRVAVKAQIELTAKAEIAEERIRRLNADPDFIKKRDTALAIYRQRGNKNDTTAGRNLKQLSAA